jgi:hypothetical protein
MLSILSQAFWSFVYLLWENVYSNPLPIFKLSYLDFCCWFINILYKFWILTSYWLYSLENFSTILWVAFCTLLIVSFAVQRLYSLVQSHFSSFAVFLCLLGAIFNKSLSRSMLWCFTLSYLPGFLYFQI